MNSTALQSCYLPTSLLLSYFSSLVPFIMVNLKGSHHYFFSYIDFHSFVHFHSLSSEEEHCVIRLRWIFFSPLPYSHYFFSLSFHHFLVLEVLWGVSWAFLYHVQIIKPLFTSYRCFSVSKGHFLTHLIFTFEREDWEKLGQLVYRGTVDTVLFSSM